MTLYFAPASMQLGQALIASVRGNILTSIIHEGQFMSLAGDLTFHMRGRSPDGSLEGILVVDDRDAAKTTTYLAERGAILDNPLGMFLIMSNGVIQQRSKTEHSISMIEFSSYAFDLTSLSSGGAVPALRPRERSTTYLLHPDPDDPYFRQAPQQFRTELHTRLTTPLYSLVFAILPLLFLGQAQSPRQSRAASIMLVAAATMVIGALAFFLPNLANARAFGLVLMYAVPVGMAVILATLVLLGAQVRPSERVIAAGEALFGRVGGLLRPGAQPAEGVS
jgi:lipopolysaccharide export system permease protein